MKRKPIVGETLYSLNIGNAYSLHNHQDLTEAIVLKVGTKFFYCRLGSDLYATKYYILTWKQDTKFSPTSRLYETQKEWYDEKEETEICSYLRSCFEYGQNKNKYTIDKLRAVKSILDGV